MSTCSSEQRDAGAALFWQLVCPTATQPASATATLMRPRGPNIHSARVAVKLVQALDLSVAELGGQERVRSSFVTPLLQLSLRASQVRRYARHSGHRSDQRPQQQPPRPLARSPTFLHVQACLQIRSAPITSKVPEPSDRLLQRSCVSQRYSVPEASS
jgi:hypothetical protein